MCIPHEFIQLNHLIHAQKMHVSEKHGVIFYLYQSAFVCVRAAVSPVWSMKDSDSDWAELRPIERVCVQLIEFMSEFFLSCRMSGGKLSCISLRHPSHCKSLWVSPDCPQCGGKMAWLLFLRPLPVTENSARLWHVRSKNTQQWLSRKTCVPSIAELYTRLS